MGSFATVATDVFFPKKVRKKFPFLKNVMVEAKKRHNMNIHALFAEAHNKYVTKDTHVLILASKVPRTKNIKSAIKEMKEKVEKRYRKNGPQWKKLKGKIKKKKKFALKRGETQIRAKYNIRPLVTVELDFFKELWNSWLVRRSNGE